MRKSRKYSSLAIERPEIAAQWDYENNEMTPDEVTAGSGYKVAWICEKGHRWRAAIGDRCKYNNGCPYCSGRFAITGENDLATLYPKIAKEWDCESNGDVRPDNIKPFGAKTYHWKCSNGHKYKASIASRTKMGLGCPYCSGHRAIPGETDAPSARAAYEYNGVYYHQGRDEDDNAKLENSKRNDVILIRILEHGLTPKSPYDIVLKSKQYKKALPSAARELKDLLERTFNVKIDDSSFCYDYMLWRKDHNVKALPSAAKLVQ